MANEIKKKTVVQAVSLILEMFSTEYPGKFSLSPQRAMLWEKMLGEFDSDIILHAAYHLAGSSEWPPNIHQMRKQCMYFVHGEIADPSAEEAWGKVMRKIQRAEGVELTELEAKALTQTASIYDMQHSTNIEAHRARYIRAFEKLVERRNEDRLTLPEIREFVGLKALPAKNK